MTSIESVGARGAAGKGARRVRTVLEHAAGVRLLDDRAANRFPTPLDASGGDDILVGRIREDASFPGAIALLLAGYQIRKGAALYAVQIAEALLRSD